MRLTLLTRLIGSILLAHGALAQQIVAPTPEQAGSPRGVNTGDYNVMESFETGYRFAIVNGSVGTYRSDVNSFSLPLASATTRTNPLPSVSKRTSYIATPCCGGWTTISIRVCRWPEDCIKWTPRAICRTTI